MTFSWEFTGANVGAIGLTVLVDVYDPAWTKIVDGASTPTAVVDKGKGLYTYVLDGSLVTTYGKYHAVAYTSGAADVKQIWDAHFAAQWVDQVRATLSASETAAVTALDDDLAGLLLLFRTMANDLDIGNFTTAEAKRFILLGKMDTEIAAKCHKSTLSVPTTTGRIRRVALVPPAGGTGYSLGAVLTLAGGTGGTVEVVGVSSGVVTAVRLLTAGSGYTATTVATTASAGTGCTVRIVELAPNLTAGTHTYDTSPIFEPSEVTLGAALTKVTLEEMGVSLEAWNNTPAGIPEKWMPTTGGSIRLYPTPSAAALTQIGSVAITAPGTGYAVGDEVAVGGAGTGGTVVVSSVGSNGVVSAIEVKDRGTGYALASGITTSGGTGSGLTAEVTELAPLRVHGYAVAEHDMLADTDIPLTIPKGFRVTAILRRALELAAIARRTTANNILAAEKLHSEWAIECEKIRKSVTGD
jgi:hypothetical protein